MRKIPFAGIELTSQRSEFKAVEFWQPANNIGAVSVVLEVHIVKNLTGPLFPIGIEHLIYMKFFCYGSSYGY